VKTDDQPDPTRFSFDRFAINVAGMVERSLEEKGILEGGSGVKKKTSMAEQRYQSQAYLY
jgi:hypothetical protein